jgi:hypothetical protein
MLLVVTPLGLRNAIQSITDDGTLVTPLAKYASKM